MKQAEGAREVLVVTGRGNQSFGRVPVVREAVRRLLGILSTRGVVEDHSEHSPGAFAVRLKPMNAGVARPAGRAPDVAEPRLDPPTLEGLSATTRDQLRTLASGTLQSLGARDPSPEFLLDEMSRQCAQLATLLPFAASANEREALLQVAISRAIERLDDDLR